MIPFDWLRWLLVLVGAAASGLFNYQLIFIYNQNINFDIKSSFLSFFDGNLTNFQGALPALNTPFLCLVQSIFNQPTHFSHRVTPLFTSCFYHVYFNVNEVKKYRSVMLLDKKLLLSCHVAALNYFSSFYALFMSCLCESNNWKIME